MVSETISCEQTFKTQASSKQEVKKKEENGLDDRGFVHPSCNHIEVVTEKEQTASKAGGDLDEQKHHN